MAERRSALDGARSGERVRFTELTGLALVQVSAFHGRIGAAQKGLERSVGLPTPAAVGSTVEDGARSILCVGPGRWWVRGLDAADVHLDPAVGAVVDQSHGRTVVEIRGARVRDLLAKGCAIDLHPGSFPPGACAATSLAHIAVVLHARDEDRIEVHAPRSYARFLFAWLEDAALEFERGPTA